LGSGGYGLLLGGVGVGAVSGAAALPRLRLRLSAGMLLTVGTLVFAAVTLSLAYVRVSVLTAVVLVIGGVAWILVLSTLNSLYQSTLPGWAKARGMSYYLVIFQGGGALGAAAFGVIAQQAGLTAALLAAAIGLAVAAAAGLRLPFHAISPEELLAAGDWPATRLVGVVATHAPVLVTVDYRPTPERADELIEALYAARFARRRTGAISWRVWREAADPGHVVEQFVVASWDEHLRQHQRVSRRDRERFDALNAMTDPARPVTVTHWLAAEPERPRRGHAATPNLDVNA
jgi:hypothetical protein